MLILVAGLVAAGTLSNFRAGTLGLLAIVTMLTGDTANTFYQFKYLGLSSTAVDRARTMLAGAIIASIGLYPMLMLIGFVDEKGEQVADTGEPGGETYGGRYAPKPGSEPTQYAYPPAGMGITPGGVEVRRV